MRALALGPLLALALALALPVASAHAVLQSASPAVNGHAEVGVLFVEIRFTEDVERQYTNANVIDLAGDSWANGSLQFDPIEKNVVRLPVRPLEDGIYSVSWQTLSVDTHTARGTFLFSVGNETLKFVDEQVSHDHSEHTPQAVVRDGVARAAFYVGLFLCLGVPLFALVVDRERGPARRLVVPASVLGLVGAAGAALLVLFLSERTGLSLAETLASAAGKTLAWRGLLLAGSAALLLVCAFAPGRAPRNLAALAALVAGGALVATALGSHAAADNEQRLLSVAADAVHLLMGAVWVGGVFGFALTARGRSASEVGTLIFRFSPLAVTSVALLILTGTYASLRHIPRVSALWTDWYGRLVVIKVMLLGPLVLMGAFNKQILGPKLARGESSPRAFRRVVAFEAITMVLILGAAGILASSPPPDRDVVEGSQGPPPVYQMEASMRTTHVVVGIRPNPPAVGIQRIDVSLHPLTADPLPPSTQVAIKIAAAGEREPETLITLEKVAPNDWSTPQESYFTSPGTWTLYLIVQRPDEYAKLEFDVDVAAPGG